jgi:Zn-dependent peptidase ImmA (M78 family)
MGVKVEGINPAVLFWARERAGRSIADVARALKRNPDEVRAWEEGYDSPTYAQLELLAYKLYKRPLALFFFPAPPSESDPRHAFRTLPDFEIDELSPTTRFRIREAQSLQLSLKELTGGSNPADRLIFRDIVCGPTSPTDRVASDVRSYLGVTIEQQTTAWHSTDDAQKAWRLSLEDTGVFVFKEAFRQDDVSGFCLYDSQFPVIYVNNSVPLTRQVFTYFHELGHILLTTSGVTKQDDSYIGALAGVDRQIEVFCNRFAAGVLLPVEVLTRRHGNPHDDQFISSLAADFKVSREMVLRRFLDHGQVGSDFYEKKAEQWRREAKKSRNRRREKSGGDYYRTHATYLGTRYMQLAFRRYYEGAITIEELALHLNVNPRSVPGLEEQALTRAAR